MYTTRLLPDPSIGNQAPKYRRRMSCLARVCGSISHEVLSGFAITVILWFDVAGQAIRQWHSVYGAERLAHYLRAGFVATQFSFDLHMRMLPMNAANCQLAFMRPSPPGDDYSPGSRSAQRSLRSRRGTGAMTGAGERPTLSSVV